MREPFYIDSVIAWCNAHNFINKIVNNHFYWQTNYQTGEIDLNTYNTYWHEWEYYNTI